MIHCTDCGAELKHPVFIAGLPYGSDCAERKLGIHIPVGCSNADPIIADISSTQDQLKTVESKRAETWGIFTSLCNALLKNSGNEWVCSFLFSVGNQIGCNIVSVELTGDYSVDKDNWKPYDGSFPSHGYISFNPLSSKQMAILNKYI